MHGWRNGIRGGLKILCPLQDVPVRVRLRAPIEIDTSLTAQLTRFRFMCSIFVLNFTREGYSPRASETRGRTAKTPLFFVYNDALFVVSSRLETEGQHGKRDCRPSATRKSRRCSPKRAGTQQLKTRRVRFSHVAQKEVPSRCDPSDRSYPAVVDYRCSSTIPLSIPADGPRNPPRG